MWPPAYTVKKHLRAKYVKLRVLQSGLQITIPHRFNLKQLPAVLEEHKEWILEQLTKKPAVMIELPTSIDLLALGETWKIRYLHVETVPRIMKHPGYELTLMGNLDDKSLCTRYLAAWVKHYAKQVLPLQLAQVSREINLPYQAVRIKNQKTVWGSCTIDKMINLNYKLVFFPYHLMRHVFIHELCHTVHMDHSKKFWTLVYAHDEKGKENRRVLRQGNQYLPNWLI